MRYCTKLSLGEKKWVQVSPLVSWVQGSGFGFTFGSGYVSVYKYFYKRVVWFFCFGFSKFLSSYFPWWWWGLLLICLQVCCCWTFIERKVAVGVSISNIHLELEHSSRRIFHHRFILKKSFLNEVSCGRMSWTTHLLIFCFKNFENFGYFCSALVIVFGIRLKS